MISLDNLGVTELVVLHRIM